jgi:hypothetical protein
VEKLNKYYLEQIDAQIFKGILEVEMLIIVVEK